jgi:hypothetical protein
MATSLHTKPTETRGYYSIIGRIVNRGIVHNASMEVVGKGKGGGEGGMEPVSLKGSLHRFCPICFSIVFFETETRGSDLKKKRTY